MYIFSVRSCCFLKSSQVPILVLGPQETEGLFLILTCSILVWFKPCPCLQYADKYRKMMSLFTVYSHSSVQLQFCYCFPKSSEVSHFSPRSIVLLAFCSERMSYRFIFFSPFELDRIQTRSLRPFFFGGFRVSIRGRPPLNVSFS